MMFRDIELAVKCIDFCDVDLLQCRNQCHGDSNCLVDCTKDAIDCFNACPCFSNCPDGCSSCQNPVCRCYDMENNPDYVLCENFYRNLYSKCVVSCAVGDNECFQKCVREYAENMKECPCEENCPLGCPCPVYQCPVTTTVASTTTTIPSRDWILVLNTMSSSRTPLIIDGTGESEEIDFTLDSNTEVGASCSIVWKSKMYIFGGSNYKRQISAVENCKLAAVGQLNFDMVFGACASRDDEQVFICFPEYDLKENKICRVSNGPLDEFNVITSSNFAHGNTRIATNDGKWTLSINVVFLDFLIATGGNDPLHYKTELLSNMNHWSVEADYPFAKSSITRYPIVTYDSRFYIFGGDNNYSNNGISTIACFDTTTMQWSKVGETNEPRLAAGGSVKIFRNFKPNVVYATESYFSRQLFPRCGRKRFTRYRTLCFCWREAWVSSNRSSSKKLLLLPRTYAGNWKLLL